MRKLVGVLFLGAVAAAAYYAYKNKEKIEEKLEDEKVVHFIDKAKTTVGSAVNKVKKEIDRPKKETVEEAQPEQVS